MVMKSLLSVIICYFDIINAELGFGVPVPGDRVFFQKNPVFKGGV